MKNTIIFFLVILFALSACGKKGPPVYQEKKADIVIQKS